MSIYGKIVHGNNIGEKIGSPTINQKPDDEKLLPPFGVYCSKVLAEGKEYYGVTNIGCKPTVSGTGIPGIETHILDFNGKIYGEEVRTSIYHYIRPEKMFSDVSELSAQIKADIEYASNYWRSGKS